MGAIAVNVGANTNEPGFRGPVDAEGRFTFLPIPESEPTVRPVPTYGEIAEQLPVSVPERVRNRPVHLDPEFAEYPCCERYSYGDPHAVKAGPLSTLEAGEYVFFYATLTVTESAGWLPPDWGAFLVGQFRLAAVLTGEEYDALAEPPDGLANNAHLKRDPTDARVFLQGDPDGSGLYERAVPLSQPSGGTDPAWPVTDLSDDSGRGPWWRRPLRFDDDATDGVHSLVERYRSGPPG
jgi:hypothetical protein